MSRQGYDCLLISDFNLNALCGYLQNSDDNPVVRATCTPYGQVVPSLLSPQIFTAADADVAIVWTQPDSVIQSFGAVLAHHEHSIDDLLQEVRDYASALRQAAKQVSIVLVPTWVIADGKRGLGVADLRPSGLEATLLEMNRELRLALQDQNNVYFLNTERWLRAAGRNAFDPRFWYTAKIPYGRDVLKEASLDIRAALAGFAAQTRKLIIVDLDDTLWGGVLGDVGWENLRLGGHDPVGEAFVAFQRELKALTRRGIVLGIASKNEEDIAMEALSRHPEMVLRPEDFAAWRINWNDKASNVVDLVEELNLGLNSVVFIDDNPSERGRVGESLPDVLVPEWPRDKMLYVQALHSLRCFDSPSITDEDRDRFRSYTVERQRQATRQSVGTLDEWQRSLDLQVTVEELNESNLKRAVQLLNKTNQMNLTTRRLAAQDLMNWVGDGERKVWCFRVSDRFGDSGLTGVTSIDTEGEQAHIVDFVLSCRVFGRDIERVMTTTAISHARQLGASTIRAELVPTEKNAPCLEFWRNSGFKRTQNDSVFLWQNSQTFPVPEFIDVVHK